MTTFIHQLHEELSSKLVVPSSPPVPHSAFDASATVLTTRPDTRGSPVKEALRELFLALEITPTQSTADWMHRLQAIKDLHEQQDAFAPTTDPEQEALAAAVVAKVAAGLYLHVLAQYLEQARQADADVEWWAELERSRMDSAYYLLQTFPDRVTALTSTILDTLRKRHIPLGVSVFSPSSFRRLFPTRSILQPNTLTLSFFPHLHHQAYPVALLPTRLRNLHLHCGLSVRNLASQHKISTFIHHALSCINTAHTVLFSLVTRPLDLTQNECAFKRQRLEHIRDDRATALGRLLAVRQSVALVAGASTSDACVRAVHTLAQDYQDALHAPDSAPPPVPLPAVSIATMDGSVQFLAALATDVLPAQARAHEAELSTYHLHRPSRLTRLWPRLVFAPPLLLLAARTAYASRASLQDLVRDAAETVRRFVADWLLAPLADVVQTVRAGADGGVIVTKESVQADLESLERMALALARDKLHYSPDQLAALAQQVRLGDLTPVMQIYEDDMRRPLRSALGGTLLRTLLVQVQKAKVDIDQALSGIDKLLKSQELTFAFVGVAPALAITYAALGYLRALWGGRRGASRYGGRRQRAAVWAVMRRIERLLIHSAPSSSSSSPAPPPVDARTTGLLLLGTAQLRAYAESALPVRSRLYVGVLEDVRDLEDATLGRAEKIRVVERMWRCWGDVLGWRRGGE